MQEKPFLLFFSYIGHNLNALIVMAIIIADIDGDGQLTSEEFTDPEINDVPDGITHERYKEERLKDFKIADEDKNGSLDRKELLVCTIPLTLLYFLCNSSIYLEIQYSVILFPLQT